MNRIQRYVNALRILREYAEETETDNSIHIAIEELYDAVELLDRLITSGNVVLIDCNDDNCAECKVEE